MSLPFLIAKRTILSNRKSIAGRILILAIAAYALSIAVMIIASGLVRGFKKEISDKMFDCWGHIHIVKAGSGRTFEQEAIQIDTALMRSLESREYIEYQEIHGQSLRNEGRWKKTKGGVQRIQAFANVPGILSHQDEFEGLIFKGVGWEYDWTYFEDYLVKGSLPDLTEDKISDHLIISQYIADRLRVDTGQLVLVHYIRGDREVKRRYRVVGMYNTGFSDFDSKFALCDIRKTQQLLSWQAEDIGGYEVYVDHIEDIGAINDYIYDHILPPQLISESILTKFPNIFNWLELQNMNEWVIMILMLLVAIINLVIMLLILILERSKMVGILKSLGAKDALIQRVFLIKAGIIILVGTLLGNFFGLFLCWLQYKTHFIKLDQANYFLSYAPIHIEPWMVLLINVLSFLVCMLALILPSLLVNKISITRILRFE